MLTSKSSVHIRTIRQIKSFRSCPNATGVSCAHLDRGRLSFERDRLASRQTRRLWLAKQWSGRFKRAGRRLGVLPPSACFQRTEAEIYT